MHLFIEAIALWFLIVLLKRGWQAGFVITCLRFGQMSLAILLTVLAGRYLGNAIAEWAYRPRIITIPATGLLVGSITLYLAELHIMRRQANRVTQSHRGFSFGRPLDRFFGLVISLLTAAILLPLLLWMAQLTTTYLSTDAAKTMQKSWTMRQSNQLIETGLYQLFSRSTDPLHAHALAYSLAHPLHTQQALQEILAAPSLQRLIHDPEIGRDLLSGDATQIEKNSSVVIFFADRETLLKLKDIGIFKGNETRTLLTQRAAILGKNKTAQAAIISLRERGLLRPDKVIALIRDPDFDRLIGEWLH
jgi:uncharacterized membrane protein required for colicin V production